MSDAETQQVRQFWQVANDLHISGEQVSLTNLLEASNRIGYQLTLTDIERIASKRAFHVEDSCTPSAVSAFLCELLTEDIKTALDPFAGYGSFLLPVVEKVGTAASAALTLDHELRSAGEYFSQDLSVDWISSDPFEWLKSGDHRFDLVVSNPPWNWRRNGKREEFEGIRDDAGSMLILFSALALSESGIGAFAVPEAIFWRDQQDSVIRSLARFGLAVDAYFAFPRRGLKLAAGIDGGLLLVRRGQQDKVFVAEVGSSPEKNAAIVKNYRSRKASKDLSSGVLVELARFSGYVALEKQNHADSLARRIGLKPQRFSDFVVDMAVVRSQSSKVLEGESIYLPIAGNQPVSTAPRTKSHIQIALRTDLVNPRYLALFFNSELGKAILGSISRGVTASISPRLLRDVDVYLPDLETQLQVLEADNRIAELQNELSELRSALHNRPMAVAKHCDVLEKVNKEDRFTDWIETLPFPLASILWGFHASADSPRKQYEYLDHFFEALAEFLATVLLSGIASDEALLATERPNLAKLLSGHNLSLERSTFGTWASLASFTAKLVRRLLNNKDGVSRCLAMFSAPSREVLEAFCNKDVMTVLKNTNGLRNNWRGHGGITSDALAKGRTIILEGYLSQLRQVFGEHWLRCRMIKPRTMAFDGSIFVTDAEVLVGTRTPFARSAFNLKEPVATGELYLLGEDLSTALKLLPFIKVMPSPNTAQNACYFYNKVEASKELRFVSYHFETEAELTQSFDDTVSAIGLILGSEERA